MQPYAYLISLIFSLMCLTLLDYRLKLAWFWDWRKVLLCITATLGFFLLWDITGISLRVFSTNPAWVSGVYFITPNLPVEEFLFLTLLGYLTVLLWRWRCLRTS